MTISERIFERLRQLDMTQKELLYLEDAIKHEQSMICFIEQVISNLEEKSLVSFFQTELKKHEELKKKLIHLLEVKSHE